MKVADYEHFISSMLFEIWFVFFTMSLVFFAISSVFFSIPSVVFETFSVVFVISPMLPAIVALAFAESGWTTIQRKVETGWTVCYPLCAQ